MSDIMNQLQGGIATSNIRRVQHPDFKRLLSKLIARDKMKIVILIETRIDGPKATQIASTLPFSNVEMISTIGFARSIWLLWNEEEVQIEVVNKMKQDIHAIVKVSPNSLD